MANTWSFFPTAATVINASLRRIRAYDPEDTTTISSTQLANALETMNFLISSWQALGPTLWCRKQKTGQALTAAQASYTVGSGGNITGINRPLLITQAWLTDASQTPSLDIPLTPMGAEEYLALSTKAAVGVPTSFWYDPEYDGSSNTGATSKGKLYLWPVPDTSLVTNRTLNFYYQRPLEDFDASSDAIDMPQEWFNAFRLKLAVAIAPEYGMQASDYNLLKEEAKEAFDLAMSWSGQMTSVTVSPAQQ
jgi:hypothetical protein